MRPLLIIAPLASVLFLGCHPQTTAQLDNRCYHVPPAPVAVSQPLPKMCSADSECDSKQLCVRSSCIGITADLAECNGARVHFDTDSADLSQQAQQKLQRVARCIKADQAMQVTIEGNADNRGTEQHNYALGDQRASAVATYLGSLGVSEAQLRTVSYGDTNPLCWEQDQDCQAKNRRAAVKLRNPNQKASRPNQQM